MTNIPEENNHLEKPDTNDSDEGQSEYLNPVRQVTGNQVETSRKNNRDRFVSMSDGTPALSIDFGDHLVTALGTQQKDDTAGSVGSVEVTGTVIDYPARQINSGSFELGMDYEDGREVQFQREKFTEFFRAASERATDPKGWQDYIDGQLQKFAGIGEGLNLAKEHTKEAAIIGWTALSDGTVATFLAKPNAINDPLFDAVGKTFDALAADSNAVNHALVGLGSVIIQASKRYGELTDREKGKVIGEAMFALVNPEGSSETGETIIKIAEQAGSRLERSALEGVKKFNRIIEELAETNPELSAKARMLLTEYAEEVGIADDEIVISGLNQSKKKLLFDSSQIEPFQQGLEGGASIERSRHCGAGGSWKTINERPSGDVVKQRHDKACVAAGGSMLTNGEVSQDVLIEELIKYWPEELRVGNKPGAVEWLGLELRKLHDPLWRGQAVSPLSLDALIQRAPFGAELLEEGAPLAHFVVVEGANDFGHLSIMDSWDATRYEMTREEFLEFWTFNACYKELK